MNRKNILLVDKDYALFGLRVRFRKPFWLGVFVGKYGFVLIGDESSKKEAKWMESPVETYENGLVTLSAKKYRDTLEQLAEARRQLEETRQQLCEVQRQLTNARTEIRMTSIRRDEAVRQLAASQERENLMLGAIQWALGEADSNFGDRITLDSKRYWWRTELRERAGLRYDPEACRSLPEGKEASAEEKEC